MLIGSQLFGHDTFNQLYFGISKFVINCRTLIMLVIHSCENFKEKKHTCVKIFKCFIRIWALVDCYIKIFVKNIP